MSFLFFSYFCKNYKQCLSYNSHKNFLKIEFFRIKALLLLSFRIKALPNFKIKSKTTETVFSTVAFQS